MASYNDVIVWAFMYMGNPLYVADETIEPLVLMVGENLCVHIRIAQYKLLLLVFLQIMVAITWCHQLLEITLNLQELYNLLTGISEGW